MSRPVHICILTTAHPTDDVRVYHKFARAFRAAGFSVTWVGPAHSVHPLHGDDPHGVEFRLGPPIRTRMDRLHSCRRIGPIAGKVPKVDIYYAPEPDSARMALRLAQNNGAKVIFDIHEVFHGALLDRWLFGLRFHPIREYMRRHFSRVASQCDLVIGVNAAVLSQYSLSHVPKLVVRSCAPSWFAGNKPADVCGIGRKYFNIIHGKSDLARGTLQVIEAAARSRAQIPGLRILMFESSVQANVTGHRALRSRIYDLGVSEIIVFRPMIPMQEMPEVLQSCDAGLIAYGRDFGIESLPNRLFEYMASGLPIIGPSYASEITSVIKAERCGILVDFENPAEIAEAFVQFSRHPDRCREMGRRSRDAFLARHNWESEIRPVIDRIHQWYTSNPI